MNEAKQRLVFSWLIKALHDLASARVLAAGNQPLFDTAVYHCQQAAEKAVKGFLVFHDHEFEKIHDVEALVKAGLGGRGEEIDALRDGLSLSRGS